MTVWIVIESDWEYSTIHAVFSSEELANAYVASERPGCDVEAWEVDQQGTEVCTRFCAKCKTLTGEVTVGESIQSVRKPGQEGISVANSTYCIGYSYDSQEHANLLAVRKRDAVISERGRVRKLMQTAKQAEDKRLGDECKAMARKGIKFWASNGYHV